MRSKITCCDYCLKELSQIDDFPGWYITLDVYIYRNDYEKVPKSLERTLDFCSLSCLKKWANENG